MPHVSISVSVFSSAQFGVATKLSAGISALLLTAQLWHQFSRHDQQNLLQSKYRKRNNILKVCQKGTPQHKAELPWDLILSRQYFLGLGIVQIFHNLIVSS